MISLLKIAEEVVEDVNKMLAHPLSSLLSGRKLAAEVEALEAGGERQAVVVLDKMRGLYSKYWVKARSDRQKKALITKVIDPIVQKDGRHSPWIMKIFQAFLVIWVLDEIRVFDEDNAQEGSRFESVLHQMKEGMYPEMLQFFDVNDLEDAVKQIVIDHEKKREFRSRLEKVYDEHTHLSCF